MTSGTSTFRADRLLVMVAITIAAGIGVTIGLQRLLRFRVPNTDTSLSHCYSCGAFVGVAYDPSVSSQTNEWYYMLRIALGKPDVPIESAWSTIESIARALAQSTTLSPAERRLVSTWVIQTSIDFVARALSPEARRHRWSQTTRELSSIPRADRPSTNELGATLGWTSLSAEERSELSSLINSEPTR